MLGGTAIQHINEQKYHVSAGDVFILKGTDTHFFSEVNNLHLYNIGYKEDVFVTFDSLVKRLPGYHALFVLEPIYRKQDAFSSKLHLNTKNLIELSHILDLLSDEFTSKEIGCELMITSYFLQIVGFLCRKYEDFSKQVKNKFIPSLAQIISYIETNYSSEISLKFLASIANISVNGLINIFKNTFNTTPLNYILSLRIHKACELILSSDKTLTEIAYDVGFTDSNYFSRVFKKMMGISPREYRKKMS